MTVQERFAAEWRMPIQVVRLVVQIAKEAGKCNERYCNGDSHKYSLDGTDKDENAKRWGIEVDRLTSHLFLAVQPYGFTGIEYTGLGPTLKRGETFVEVPY